MNTDWGIGNKMKTDWEIEEKLKELEKAYHHKDWPIDVMRYVSWKDALKWVLETESDEDER